MTLGKARRLRPDGRSDGVSYRQQYIRCRKAGCTKCPPRGPGHGPYWYGFYWDYRQRTKSFYVGKQLPDGAELVEEAPTSDEPAPAEGNEKVPPKGRRKRQTPT